MYERERERERESGCVCTYKSEYARYTLHLCSSFRLSFFCVDIFRFMQDLLILFANYYIKKALCCSHMCACVFVTNEDISLYNDTGMTQVLQGEGDL